MSTVDVDRGIDTRPAGAPPPSTVIGIPTYRRPALLARLLESLVDELRGHDVIVIVADNECSDEIAAIVRSFVGRLPAVESLPVATRGISANRNALVDAAFSRVPQWQWLMMLDDDGIVEPGWYQGLKDVALRTGAHVTGGAVEFPLPEGAGIFARNSEFARPRRLPTGVVPGLIGTQSTCFARKAEALIQRPWFNPSYGLSGGEDHELFLRLKNAGAVFAWADEALVREPTSLDRASVRSVLHRSFTAGVTDARSERAHRGRFAAARATCGHMFRVPLALLVHTLLMRKDKVVRTIISAAYTAGRLPGLSRLVPHRYEK